MRRWLLLRAAARVRRRLLARSGPLARALRYPLPRRGPAYRPVMHVARDSGIGDVVMITPALRELKRRNPSGRLLFYTDFPDLVRGLPYIDEVLAFSQRPRDAIFVEYTNLMPSPAHISTLMGDRLGVAVTDTRPDCVIDPVLADGYRRDWRDLPRPWVVILRRASRFTPNKDWPDASWDAVVAELGRCATVIEIGLPDDAAGAPPAHYVDLRGATSVAELAAAVAAADIYVGPVSGPMHIAAAAGTPAIVVIGGYEHPANAHRPGNVAFYTPLACAPCWLREPCPFDLACLRAITSAQVVAAVARMWEERGAGAPTPAPTPTPTPTPAPGPPRAA